MSDKCELDFLSDLKGQVFIKNEAMQRIDAMVAKLRAKDPLTPDGIHYANAAERVAAEMKGEAANYELQILHTYQALEQLNRRMELLVADGINPERAYRDTLISVGNAGEAEGSRAMARFVTDMERSGFNEQFAVLHGKDRQFTLDFMTELSELNKTDGAQVGKTKNKAALEMAKVFDRHVQNLRLELRKMGLKTANLEGRILRQLWDRDRLILAAPTADDFVRLVNGRISRIGDELVADMTPDQLRGILKEFYQEVLGQSIDTPTLGPRDLVMERQTYASRQAQSRVIHFKSVEDELFVLENFGGGDVQALLLETLRDLGKQVQLTRELGVNYRYTAEALLSKVADLGGDPSRVRRGAGTGGFLTPENILDGIDGYHDQAAVNPKLAQWVDSIHNYARAHFLAAASLNTISDIPTLNTATRRYGMEASGNITRSVAQMFKGVDLPPDVLREAAGIIEAESVQMLGNMHRYVTLPGIDNAVYNGSVWVTEKTFKWNGLNRITRMMKSTAYRRASGMVAELIEAKSPWESLTPAQRRLMVRGGLTDKDWGKLTDMGETAVYKEGPVSFVDISKLDLATAARVNATLARFVSGEAVLSPDVGTRVILNFGTRRGTAANALARQSTFLLGYPVAFMRQALATEAETGGYMSRNIMRYVAMLAFYGTMVQVARDFSQGRTRDYDDPEVGFQVLMEGVLRGGGLTLPGELLFKWTNADAKLHHLVFGADAQYATPRTGPFNPAQDLLVGGGTEWAVRLVGGAGNSLFSAVQGDIDKSIETLLNTTRRAIPTFAPGVKDVLDGMLFEELYNMSNSDTMERAERRWYSRTGGDFLLTDFQP